MIVVKVGNEKGIQFVKWDSQSVHGAKRVVAGIEQEELTVDEDSRTSLGPHLRNRTTCTAQNGGDPIGALQGSCRFVGLVLVVDDRAAEGSFSAVSLQQE
jgi:hypothetical protein